MQRGRGRREVPDRSILAGEAGLFVRESLALAAALRPILTARNLELWGALT